MQHVVAPVHRAPGDFQVGEVSLEEVDATDVVQIAALAGDERVGDADAVTAPDELLREVGSDEAGAAGDQVVSHADTLAISTPECGGPRKGEREKGAFCLLP